MSTSTKLWTTIPFLLIVSGIAVADDNWPRFRGPQGRGVGDDRSLPTEWDTKTNVLWQVEVPGRGWSSPIIWDDHVFVMAVINDKTPLPRKGLYIQDLLGKTPPGEHVWMLFCYDFTTGKLRWERTLHKGTPGGPIHLKNTYASETPVTDGQHVYVYVGNLGLYCYDMDGNHKWSKSIGPQKTRMGWGTGSSPVLHGDRLYLVNDNEEASHLLAVDKHKGKEIWRTDREEKSTWGTPLVWQNKLRTEIVTAGTRGVRSYDLAGKLLWELNGMSSISIPSPFPNGELVYVTSGYVLDPLRPLYAIKQGAMGDISLKDKETSNDAVVWRQPLAGPYHPTPLVYRDQIYVLLDRGFLASYDARTGKEVYPKQRIDPGSDKFTASLWAADGKIYSLSEDGDTYVIKAGPTFEVLAKNSLDEMCLATPAVSRGGIVLRTMTKLYRIGPPQKEAAKDEQYGAQRKTTAVGPHKGFVLLPEKAATGKRPWVWYAPTIGSHPNQNNAWVLRKLLDRGFYVCGINVGESYGNPAGRKAFSEFYDHVVREYNLEPKARLLAQSRGGLMLYNWAADNPDKVQCVAGIYPVCDLRSYPGLAKAAGAYGMTPDELEKQLTKHNPVDRLAPLAKAGIPVLHIHGDADRVVPLNSNSQVVYDRYRALGGKMKLLVIQSKGHAEIPEFFQEPEVVQFLADGGFANARIIRSQRPGKESRLADPDPSARASAMQHRRRRSPS